MKKLLLATMAVIMACAGIAQASTYSYTDSGKWEVAANWDTGRVPGDDGAGGLEQQNIVIIGNSQVTFDATTWTYLGANNLLYSATEYRGGLRLLMGENTSGSTDGSHSLTLNPGAGNKVAFTTGSSQAVGSRLNKTSTLNITSGIVDIGGNPFNIGTEGTGIINISGGSLTAGRSAPNVGTGTTGGGEINITGGSFTTRAGLTVGANGTVHVIGSGATEIGMGSNGTLDGEYIQLAGGTLKADIDAGGITKIFVDDTGEGTVQANFAAGSILDLSFINIIPYSGTWTLLELENADIVDGGLALAAGVDSGWSFNIDNSGANGLLTVTYASAQAAYWWDGTSSSAPDEWEARFNWTEVGVGTPATFPGAGDDVIFNNSNLSAGQTVHLNAHSQEANSLAFNSRTAGAMVINRNSGAGVNATSLTVGSGGISMFSGAGTVTFGNATDQLLNMKASDSLHIDNDSASLLTFPRGWSSSSSGLKTLSLAGIGSGGILFGGVIEDGSGSIALSVETDSATVTTLEAANTFSGGITITDGIVGVGDDAALGTGTLIMDGGTVASDGGARSLANAVTMNAAGGTFAATDGALTLSSEITGSGTLNATDGTVSLSFNPGTGVYDGDVNVGDGATLNLNDKTIDGAATGSTLTVGEGSTLSRVGNNNVALGGRNIVLDGDTTFSHGSGTIWDFGVISGDGELTVIGNGSGKLQVDGLVNTYGGGTHLDGGQVRISSNAGFGLAGTSLTLEDGGTVLAGGNFSTGTREIILAGSGGELQVYNNKTVTIPGVISGTNMTVLNDGGQAVFEGSNTYSGGTEIQGLVRIGGANVDGVGSYLGSGDVTLNDIDGARGRIQNNDNHAEIANNLIITNANNGGRLMAGWSESLTVSGVVSGSGLLTIVDDSGTVILGNEANTFSGDIVLGDGSNGGQIGKLKMASLESGSYDGTISGDGALTYAGSGTQTLSGNNSYNQGTTVEQGKLIVVDDVAGSSDYSVDSGATLEFNVTTGTQQLNGGTLGGGGTLVKSGSGTLMLGADGSEQLISMTGGLIDVQAGTLRNEYSNGNWNNNLASLNVESGATVDTWDSAGGITVDALTGAGTVQHSSYGNANNLTVGVNGGGGTFNGIIQDSGKVLGLVKKGAGTQILTGNNTYSADTEMNGGTLQIGNGGSTGSVGSGDVRFAGSAILAFNRTDSFDMDNTIKFDGSAPVMHFNSGTVRLGGSADNVGASAIVKSGATLELNKVSSGSVHALGGDATIEAGGTMRLTGTGGDQIYYQKNLDVAGTLDLNGLSDGIGALNGAATGIVENNNNSAATLSVGYNAGTFGGVLQDGTGTGALSLYKYGSTTQTLSGDSTYSGTTTIEAGTLLVNGDNSAATGTITVQSGGTLGGIGTIGGAVSVSGTVAPGNSIGTLTVNNSVTFNSGSTFVVETDAISSDKLVLTGTSTLDLGTGNATLSLPDTLSADLYVIAAAETISGRFASYPNDSNSIDGTYYLHYVSNPSGDDHIQINKSSTPTSSGVDVRAYQGADGVYVEFVAYDVEADGSIMLALMDADGSVAWQGSVNVTAGPRFVARFLVPSLELGGSYNFLVRDEVGKWWEANGVTVAGFDAEMVSATLSGITITFDSAAESTYQIHWSAELGGSWSNIAEVVAEGPSTSVTVEYPDSDNPSGFFRVVAP